MTEPTSDSRAWWRRSYLFSLIVLLIAPVIFFVFTAIAGGLTPDSRCTFCERTAVLSELPADLADAERSHANVERWVAYVGAQLTDLHRHKVEFEWERSDGPEFDPPQRGALEIAADELQARYAYAIPATLLILISIPIGCVALAMIWPRGRSWRLLALVVSVVAVIAVMSFQDGHPVRLLTAEYLLGKAALEPYPFLSPHTWELAFLVVDVSVFCTYGAVGLLIVVMASIAASGNVTDPKVLRAAILRRARGFKLATGLGSLVLILGVAATHGLFQWPSALMAPASQGVVSSLASSAALYWGVFYSLMLIGVTVPAAIAIQLDMRQLSSLCEETSDQIATAVGFTFDWRQSLGTLATIAGPVLTAPVLQMLNGLGS